MGAAREGYNLFTRIGWRHFQANPWSLSKLYVLRDTFGWVGCKIMGSHVPYNAGFQNAPEWACKRCQHFIGSREAKP